MTIGRIIVAYFWGENKLPFYPFCKDFYLFFVHVKAPNGSSQRDSPLVQRESSHPSPAERRKDRLSVAFAGLKNGLEKGPFNNYLVHM